MKMHKIELYVIDFEDHGVDDFCIEIDHSLDGLVRIASTSTVDIGDWQDSHELNYHTTPITAFQEYFQPSQSFEFTPAERSALEASFAAAFSKLKLNLSYNS